VALALTISAALAAVLFAFHDRIVRMIDDTGFHTGEQADCPICRGEC